MRDFSLIICSITAFLVTVLLGYILIPYLRHLKFGQTILDEGPAWHKEKQGTPTMGGIMMIVGVLVALAVGYAYSASVKIGFVTELGATNRKVGLIASIFMPLCMAAIGFIDDYIKVVKKRNLGLTARQKTFLQLFVATCYLVALCIGGMHSTYIPFVGYISIINGFGLLFWPISVLFIYGFTNAVNLTDGVDGLAASVTVVVACTFMLASVKLRFYSINVLSACLAGACVGFAFWNTKPAKVFMGDTGSMFLGGMVVALSFGIGRPILLIFAGITYLLEALSDIIQVAYYKKTKKRIFKMAPLHHHFEMCGWSEQKIVLVFSGVAFAGGVIALLPILLNF